MSQKQYWTSLEELNNPAAQQLAAADEFREELPFDLTGGLLEAKRPAATF